MPQPLPIATALVLAIASLSGCRAPGGTVEPSPPPAPAGSVTGTARFEGQVQHAGLLVRLVSGDASRETHTDAKGRYAFEDVPYGDYALDFEQPRYFSQRQAVSLATPSASVQTIVLSNHRVIYPSATLYDAARTLPLTSLTLVPGGAGLAFVEAGILKRIPMAGGAAQPVRDFGLAPGDVVDSFDWTGAGLAFAVSASGSSAPRYDLWRTAGSDPAGAVQLATTSEAPLLAPAFSPDGNALAFLAQVPEPWSSTELGLSGQSQLAIVKRDAQGSETSLARFLIHPQWSFGFGPIQWGTRGILFHKPMFCTLSSTYGLLDGDGLFLIDPASAALKKLWFYSEYDHAPSRDGEWVYFHSGRSVFKRRIDDARPYNQGAVTVGYDASLQVGSLCPSPGDDRLYYVSGRGIEEMIPLE